MTEHNDEFRRTERRLPSCKVIKYITRDEQVVGSATSFIIYYSIAQTSNCMLNGIS